MSEESDARALWIIDRVLGSVGVFLVLAVLRGCWRKMQLSQKLALGEAFEIKRQRTMMGSPSERRALLYSPPRIV